MAAAAAADGDVGCWGKIAVPGADDAGDDDDDGEFGTTGPVGDIVDALDANGRPNWWAQTFNGSNCDMLNMGWCNNVAPVCGTIPERIGDVCDDDADDDDGGVWWCAATAAAAAKCNAPGGIEPEMTFARVECCGCCDEWWAWWGWWWWLMDDPVNIGCDNVVERPFDVCP